MAQATRQSSMVGELEASVEISVPASKYYQMLAASPQDLPKATPDNIKGCQLREGEFGKVGSVIFWNFVIDGQPKVLKERIEAMDPEKNLIAASIIDGDMMKEFKSFFVTIQATPKQSGHGSVVKCHFKYERNSEKVDYPEHPEKLPEVFVKATKDMDQMLSSRV